MWNFPQINKLSHYSDPIILCFDFFALKKKGKKHLHKTIDVKGLEEESENEDVAVNLSTSKPPNVGWGANVGNCSQHS